MTKLLVQIISFMQPFPSLDKLYFYIDLSVAPLKISDQVALRERYISDVHVKQRNFIYNSGREREKE